MRNVFLLLVMLCALAACGGNATPQVVTYAPTATHTVVITPTPSPDISTPLPTSTPVPTRPPTTPTVGPSPTRLVAPTLSPAPSTLTATSAPTLAGLDVEYFTTDSEFVMPGENVTLFWNIRGADSARIFRVNEEGERLSRWDVNVSGSLTVTTRTSERDAARFEIEGETLGVTVEQLLLIPLRCPESWFFEPAPDSCPAALPAVSFQAEQTFEGGRMIWVETLDRIYVIFEDGIEPGWAQYPDDWVEGDPERDDTLTVPPDLMQPVRGFGLVWRSVPRVQERLGWAVGPEVAFEGMYQADSPEQSVATLYLRMRDGGIVALDSLDNTWQIFPPGAGETS